MEFEIQRFTDNLNYLLKQKKMKIGEFENLLGVHIGYMSRLSKEDPAVGKAPKPGIDFIIKAANFFSVSLDALIFRNLSSANSTENYIASFLDKLRLDTELDKLQWVCDPANKLNKMDENPVFVSNTFGTNTFIHGDCFHLNMKNGYSFLIMNVCEDISSDDEVVPSVIEAWMCLDNKVRNFLGSTSKEDYISELITKLYKSVNDNIHSPKIQPNVRTIIDEYLASDDLPDDSNF